MSNPVAEFATTLVYMARYRALIPIDKVIGDDLQMMTQERVVVGLRSPWVRRVALPAWKVHQALSTNEGTRRERGLKALEILSRCKDDELVATFAAYIGIHYLTPPAQNAGHPDPDPDQRSLLP